MKILVTGGSGLLGRALCAAFRADGHQLTVLSRRPARVAALCGEGVQALASLADWNEDVDFDALVNLAGAPIIDLPWSRARKAVLQQSRIGLTRALVEAIARAPRKPRVLLSASAIGYYGDTGDQACSERCAAPAEADFAVALCAAWEAAAVEAEALGVRVCLLRTGLVLSPEGGMLGRMRLPFRLGLGSSLGDGQQWMSWIHLADWVGAVRHLLQDDAASGPFNLSAPYPVRNGEFSAQLAASFGRSLHLATPAWVLRLLLGERAALLLGSQRILPERLQAAAYHFGYERLDAALADLHGSR